MKIRDLIRLMQEGGWHHVRTTGSHRHFKHDFKPGVVTIPGHPNDDIPVGTLKSVLRGWTGGETEMKYAVVFEPAESNWAAYVPDLPGCISTGTTLEETTRNIREAVKGHIRTLKEFGDPISLPRAVAGEIEISPAA